MTISSPSLFCIGLYDVSTSIILNVMYTNNKMSSLRSELVENSNIFVLDISWACVRNILWACSSPDHYDLGQTDDGYVLH